jgi:anti-sigma regulatory factor (Ser/Thr protein kinase)
MSAVAAALGDGFVHGALLYSGDADYVCGTEAFIRSGLEADETVLVVVEPDKQSLLRDALGRDARSVTFEDMDDVGHNPGCIIAVWREFVATHTTSTRGVRGIGEPISPRRSAAELAECHQHESLLNVAFDGGVAWSLLCPYDVEALDPSVVADARQTHPHLIEDGTRCSSHAFDPRTADLWLNAPLPAPPANARCVAFDAKSLRTVRSVLTELARTSGLSDDRTADLVLAVNELATNSVTHGAGTGTLTFWADGHSLICDVFDSGHLHDPLAGRRRPDPRDVGGRGLWLANQLSDLTQLRRMTAGTRIRLHFSVN